jgi:hypothetical protein
MSLMAEFPASAGPAPKPRLGTNLNGPDDWNTEIPFVDVFRLARRWISQQEGAGWNKGPALDLDENGWVKSLEPGCWVETPILTVSGRLPAGIYTVLYEGSGKLSIKGSDAARIEVLKESDGRILLDVKPTPVSGDGSVFVAIRQTDPQNYLRNIRILLPDSESTYLENPFRPGFFETWKGMAAFRFMDWMKTNNSKITKWSERPTLESATWTRQGGVPVEVMVDFANRQKADAWFCMPHMADDDYVRNFALLVKEKLDPSLKVYVEFSNEVWNSMFDQHKWANEQGLKEGLANTPWEAGWKYYAKRSLEIFKIWEDVFGGSDRLITVLSTQAGNAYVGEQILKYEDAGKKAKALAIAPYVGFNIPERSDSGKQLTAAEVAGWTVDQVMQEMMNTRLPEAIKSIEEHKALADRYGLTLLGYEGGQHAVGIQGGENNDQLTALLHEANRSKAMGELYTAYFEAWESLGGDLMAQFSSIGRWSKWGSWGLMEYYNSNPEDYPKFQATMRWAKKKGQAVNAP